MIPNIAMDNTVDKHIRAQSSNGNEDWKPGGKRIGEWNARKE